MIFEKRSAEYFVSDDKTLLEVELVHRFLTNAYWAKGRTIETVRGSIQHSLYFGIYSNEVQIGFARVISDYTTFALTPRMQHLDTL